MTTEKPKTVALVLGSGGARGYAHIGVIEVLQERGYKVIAVSGCSVGAMVAGVYAAGKLQAFKDWATGLDQFDVFKLMDLSLMSPGAIRGNRVFSFVKELVGDVKIEDLSIPYTAVATDLLAHKEVWFQEGLLHEAMRASIAIPSFLAPVMSRGRLLVDGGLLNPLPIFPTISSHADLILAVNLSWEDGGKMRLKSTKDDNEDSRIDHWFDKLKTKTSLLFEKNESDSHHFTPKKQASATNEPSVDGGLVDNVDAGHRVNPANEEFFNGTSANNNAAGEGRDRVDPEKTLSRVEPAIKNALAEDIDETSPFNDDSFEVVDSSSGLPFGMFDIMNLSFEAMQSALTDYKLAGYPPDVLVNISKHACRTFDFHKAPELIQLGREHAIKALDKYELKCDTYTDY